MAGLRVCGAGRRQESLWDLRECGRLGEGWCSGEPRETEEGPGAGGKSLAKASCEMLSGMAGAQNGRRGQTKAEVP